MEIKRVYNQLHDDFSLSVHTLFYKRLQKEPSLLQVLKQCWDEWDTKDYVLCDPQYRQLWLDAIQSGVDSVGKICLREDDLGQVLRSCSPMFLWKNPEERLEYMRKFYTDYKSDHPTQQPSQ